MSLMEPEIPVKPSLEGSVCFLESSTYPPAERAARRFSGRQPPRQRDTRED